MEEEKVVDDNSNTQGDVDTNSTDVGDEGEEQEEEESIEDVKAKLAKSEEIADNQRIRAEKAEKANKAPKDVETPQEKPADISSKDTIAIINAKVPTEDVDEVVSYAKYKGISVSEALNDSVMKATLNLRAEERNTATATNTGTSRRSAPSISDDAILQKAKDGKLPESDADIAKLMKAKQKENI